MRQRRNRAPTAAQLPAESEEQARRVPQLPKVSYTDKRSCPECGHEWEEPVERKWHRLTRAWWRDVWHSPMAGEYLEADIHGLYRLAVLVDRFWYEGTKELAAEIRQQQTAFGLTPIDRMRLQWSIQRTEKPRPAQPVAPEGDPRSLLQAVK